MRILLPFLLFLSATGCGFDEELPEITIRGSVVLPAEAATRTITDATGETREVTDVRFIGPVYLGAFADVRDGYFEYPHPEMGPIIDPAYPGDTYPYGGTSVGRFDFACFEAVACQVTTGRFASFEGILEYFKDFVGEPVVDPFEEEVTSPEYYAQYCFEYYHYTSLDEFGFLAVECDDEGNCTEDLDFQQQEDGTFKAEFSMPHTLYKEGMKLWGWADNPSEAWTFSTCDPDVTGPMYWEYNQDFEAGGGHRDVLNFPSLYIFGGDWVVSEPWTMSSPEDEPVLVLDYHHE